MSRVERAPSSVRPARPVAIDLPAIVPAVKTLCVFWRIGADALRAAQPALASQILGDQRTLAHDEVALELSIDLRDAKSLAIGHTLVQACLVGPRGRAPLDPPASIVPLVTFDSSEGLLHVDAKDQQGPLLHVTVRLESDGARLLYARTAIPTRLGLPGGRYEPDRAEAHA